jgi:hypothetical protein
LRRVGTAIENMTTGHRGIPAGSAFCWLYDAWAHGNTTRGIEPLPPTARVVEVGNGGLHSLGYLCDVAPPGWEIIAIDPYVGPGRFAEMLLTACSSLGNVIDRVKIVRWPSPEAARIVEDFSCDAILIDGDHSYDAVRLDLAAWRDKVKNGGYLAGDDVDPDFEGCERAWEEAFPNARLYGSTAVVRFES